MIEYSTRFKEAQKDQDLQTVLERFKQHTHLNNIKWEIKERSEGNYLLIYLSDPTERFFRLLNEIREALPEENPYRERMTLKTRPKSPKERLSLPETQLLRTTLSESLTVTSHSFQEDFFSRYIQTVFGAEDQIIANANHIVYGRRGAGKSSLLAYLLHILRRQHTPHAWVAMQAYTGRTDPHVIVDILLEIVEQLHRQWSEYSELESLKIQLHSIAESEEEPTERIHRLLPKIRRAIFPLTEEHERIVIFIDDLHVIHKDLQPRLLAALHSISQNNKTFLKISGIEQFTRNWDPAMRLGLETPHDAQVIKLDYNLTIPEKSKSHIQRILDAHAKYCGLPSVGFICGKGVLSRLVWVAAGVPRDALNIFAQAIGRAMVKDQQKVSITSINAAASEMAQEKIKDIEQDASGRYEEVRSVLEEVKEFCINDKRKNAFLVEIRNDHPTFERMKELIALRFLHVLHEGITPERMKELIALRFLHVLHEGITPGEAGRQFMALLLDYGFYVGIRAACSVDLFQKEPQPLQAKELRKLPIFPLPAK